MFCFCSMSFTSSFKNISLTVSSLLAKVGHEPELLGKKPLDLL